MSTQLGAEIAILLTRGPGATRAHNATGAIPDSASGRLRIRSSRHHQT